MPESTTTPPSGDETPSTPPDFWASRRQPFCVDTTIAASEVVEIRRRFPDLPRGAHVLEIGAGDPNKGEKTVPPKYTYIPTDKHPIDVNVGHLDILEGPAEKEYDAVLAVRVLSNIPREARARAFDNIRDSLRSGGWLILCDSDQEALDRINDFRVKQGWNKLPPSSSGSESLTREEWDMPLGWSNVEPRVTLIASHYVIWTRAMQKTLLSYDNPMRGVFPTYEQWAQNVVGALHQLHLYRKR